MTSDGRKDREDDTHAVVILIDNSFSAMNEDFHKNRLEAQKTTTERYASFLFSTDSPNSQIAIGTMSNAESGIRMSFTNSLHRITDALQRITTCGTHLVLVHAIKCAVLALRHFSATRHVDQKRIMVFVGSQNDAESPEAKQIAPMLLREGIVIEIFVIGSDVSNFQALFSLCLPGDRSPSTVIHIPTSQTVLSDNVLASVIQRSEHNARHSSTGTRRKQAFPPQTRSTRQSRRQEKAPETIAAKDEARVTERTK